LWTAAPPLPQEAPCSAKTKAGSEARNFKKKKKKKKKVFVMMITLQIGGRARGPARRFYSCPVNCNVSARSTCICPESGAVNVLFGLADRRVQGSQKRLKAISSIEVFCSRFPPTAGQRRTSTKMDQKLCTLTHAQQCPL